ncbi:MAG: hypothetical protein HZA79_12500 [Sphingobacteriales bacterium]|nr:hypothetical protein [Sphingobacteriales bacterium]
MNRLFFRQGIFFLVLLCSAFIVRSQVSFVFNTAALGRDMRGLSAVQLINTGRDSYTGNLDIEIRNLERSLQVVKIVVTGVQLLPGSNIIPAGKFGSAAVFYAPGKEGDYVRQTGMMPEGELEYCFKYTVTSKDNTNEIFDNCFTGTAILSTPLELILPDNGDEFCQKRPRFSWQPSLPLAPGTDYTLKLAKKQNGQTQAEALLINLPVVLQAHIKGSVFPFPAATPDLQEGATYVWQVTADNKGIQKTSEVWEFTIQCEKTEPAAKSYRELKESDDGGYLTTGPVLRFAVFNSFTAGKLTYSIKDLTNPEKKFSYLPVAELQKGNNNISVDLKKVPGMEDGNEYLLQVVLPDGKKVSVRFKYSEDEE